MKNILFIILVFFGTQLFSQNSKCLTFSNDIIKDVNGKIVNQYLGYQDVYNIKADVPSYDLMKIKTACDTSFQSKVTIDWKLNYDKNWEKQFSIGGKIVLITIYPTDKCIYFEFPNK